MNTTEEGVTNAANLSFFMVNLSQVMLKDKSLSAKIPGVLDLKSYLRGLKYAAEILKLLLQKREPILIQEIIEQVGSLGCIYTEKAMATSS